MTRAAWVAAVVTVAAARTAGGADVVFESPRLRAVLGPDGVWRKLVDKATGTDHCAAGERMACAAARVGGKSRPANRASMAGGKLHLGFAGCNTVLTYAVRARPDWILFTLTAVSGRRPSHVTLLRLPVTITEHVGTRLNCAWNDKYAICLMGGNLQTRGRAQRRTGFAELAATTQDAPGPKLEGAAAALVGAATADLDGVLHRLSAALALPRNAGKLAPSKRLPLARQSYWFLTFGEADVGKVIECCGLSGLRQVMMSSNSWCRTVGHYTFHTGRYGDGIESLRRTVAKLHEAGILVGMHCFASKISKTDAYVTPVPDRRFWVDRAAELAADIGPADTSIRTAGDLREWPGSPAARQKTWEGGVAKHREAVIDDEIIRYDAVGPEGKWNTLLGCRRGSWGTKAAAHKAAAPVRHYGVDGCINGYIIDQETTLLDEATDRLADIFNRCGFDMVYFDGGEDVDRRRFTYYVSKFQATAMRKFRKRPLVHMGTIMTHNLWHSFTRSATVDTYSNTIRGRIVAGGKWETLPTVREHIDRSVRYMLSVGQDRMPGELGWFGIWPKGRGTDGLQLDQIEYLMAKSLAHDAPISLQTSFRSMAAHPLTPGILEIVRAYEQLRVSGKVDTPTRTRLRTTGRDFLLLREREGGPAEFVNVAPAASVAGGREVRALIGRRGRDVAATVWHYLGKEGKLLLDVPARRACVVDVFGRKMPGGRAEGNLEIPLSCRRATVVVRAATCDSVRRAMASARVELPSR